MAVIKHFSKVPYTIIDNSLINDDRISWKARGILLYILSKPQNWEIRVEDLINNSPKDGKIAVRSGIEELILAGYAELCIIRNETTKKLNGREYIFYHTPLFKKGFRKKENKSKRFKENEELIMTDSTKNNRFAER